MFTLHTITQITCSNFFDTEETPERETDDFQFVNNVYFAN